MIKKFPLILTAMCAFAFTPVAYADEKPMEVAEEVVAVSGPVIGEPAPTFTATDTNGNVVNLEDLKGKVVVLEWTNHECPFVIKHYKTGNMQSLQAKAQELGVTWVSIVSSAAGKQGAINAEESNAVIIEKDIKSAHRILDPEGIIGALYDAKTTPHMFVIDVDGNLAYQGAIDDNPSPRQSAVKDANNYVLAAMTALVDGTKIEVAETRSYGCSVKY